MNQNYNVKSCRSIRSFLLFLSAIFSALVSVAQPTNDDCLNAIALPYNSYCASVSYTNAGATASSGAPAPTCANYTTGDVWFSMVVPSSGHLIFDTQTSGLTDCGMSVYTGSCGALTEIYCDDDNSANGLMPYVDVPGLTVGSTVYARVWDKNGDASGTFGLCAYDPENVWSLPNNICAGADPFCTGSTYNFPAGVGAGTGESGPNYGCLSTTPNPVWYYLKIATPGTLEIKMNGSGSYDIDFACWGPYSSPTAPCTAQLTGGSSTSHHASGASSDYPSAAMIDCSYDPSMEEWCYLPNAQVGEYYLLLITNYANTPQNIVFSQTGGTGSTDCSIVAPPVSNNGPLCVGQTLHLNVANPVAGATYAWTGPNSFSSNATNPYITNVSAANAGVYTLVISVGGVPSPPVTTTVVVNPNPNITATASPSTICTGTSTSLTGNSDVAGTTYSWNPGGLSGSPVTVSPTADATYTVTGTVAGCTGLNTVSVTVVPQATPTFTALGPYCEGSVAGLLPGTASDGTTGTWSPSVINTAIAGTSTYTFTPDAGQCATNVTMDVTVDALPSITFPALSAICLDGASITLNSATPAGGTYSGTGVSSNSFDPAISGAGTHTITYTYTDASTCVNSATQTITVNAGPSATFTLAPAVGCVNVDETVTYTGNGGAGTTFAWDFDGGTASPGTGVGPHQVNWATSGSYTVTLTATENGCASQPYTQNVTIGQLTVTTQLLDIVSCFGLSDAEATVNVTGGALPYDYEWLASPVQTTQIATGLAIGTYTVNVTDSAGCSASSSVIITQPTALVADLTDSAMIACYGDNNGMAQVTAGGGTLPYQYQWASSASTTNQVLNYLAGSYFVTVTDAHGCSVVVPFTITQNPALTLTVMPTDEGCENSCNGEMMTTVQGGVPPYSYHWSPGSQTTPSVLDLCTGNYAVTITDAVNCSISDNATVATNTIITANAIVDPLMGIAPATINFAYTGGGGTLFTWDFGDGTSSTDQNPVHIYEEQGTYVVVLTVNSGAPDFCEDVYTVEVIIFTPSSVEIPNVFTPNADGYNDVFKVMSEGLDSENMVIFNRWGKKVWEWTAVHGEWSGAVISGGVAAAGEYFFIFDGVGYDGQEYHVNGIVTLLF